MLEAVRKEISFSEVTLRRALQIRARKTITWRDQLAAGPPFAAVFDYSFLRGQEMVAREVTRPMRRPLYASEECFDEDTRHWTTRHGAQKLSGSCLMGIGGGPMIIQAAFRPDAVHVSFGAHSILSVPGIAVPLYERTTS